MQYLEQARAILGEHLRNYVIVYQTEDDPNNFDLTFSDPYAAKGLLESATKYHNTFIEGGTEMDYEWSEVDDDDDDDNDDFE